MKMSSSCLLSVMPGLKKMRGIPVRQQLCSFLLPSKMVRNTSEVSTFLKPPPKPASSLNEMWYVW